MVYKGDSSVPLMISSTLIIDVRCRLMNNRISRGSLRQLIVVTVANEEQIISTRFQNNHGDLFFALLHKVAKLGECDPDLNRQGLTDNQFWQIIILNIDKGFNCQRAGIYLAQIRH